MDAILHWLNYWAGGTEIQGVLLTASHRKLVHRSDMFRAFKVSTDQLRKIILLQLIQASFQLERKLYRRCRTRYADDKVSAIQTYHIDNFLDAGAAVVKAWMLAGVNGTDVR